MIRGFSELWFFSLKIGSIDLESSVVVCIKHTGVPCVFLGFFSSIQVFSECVADDKNLGTLYGPRVQLAEMWVLLVETKKCCTLQPWDSVS